VAGEGSLPGSPVLCWDVQQKDNRGMAFRSVASPVSSHAVHLYCLLGTGLCVELWKCRGGECRVMDCVSCNRLLGVRVLASK